MERISDWWNHPLAADVHGYLRLQELSIPPIRGVSPQLGTRRYLVDWLAAVCEKFKLSAASRHLTVLLLDIFMDHYDIMHEHLKLVTIGCLLIACKFEEKEINIPKYAELNLYFTKPYDNKTYLSIELQLLSTFKWKIGLPTAAHFSEYYYRHAMDGVPVQQPKEREKYQAYIAKYMEYFLEISLQDEFYRQYTPSMVAAFALAASRFRLKCSPVWTSHLENLTGYAWDDLHQVVCRLQRILETDEKRKEYRDESNMTTPPRGADSPLSPSANLYQKITMPVFHATALLNPRSWHGVCDVI